MCCLSCYHSAWKYKDRLYINIQSKVCLYFGTEWCIRYNGWVVGAPLWNHALPRQPKKCFGLPPLKKCYPCLSTRRFFFSTPVLAPAVFFLSCFRCRPARPTGVQIGGGVWILHNSMPSSAGPSSPLLFFCVFVILVSWDMIALRIHRVQRTRFFSIVMFQALDRSRPIYKMYSLYISR